MEAVKEMLPQAEHRQCARHIASNFTKRFTGVHYENLFWEASKATTESDYKKAMTQIEALNTKASKYLLEKDPKTWSRAFFQTGRCDANVENGCSESFNSVIVEARKKPITTMLEELRLYMIDKLYKSPNKQWTSFVSPNIRGLLNELKDKQRSWEVLPSGGDKFEARQGKLAFKVDLEMRTFDCRLWRLNGYGCVH